MLRYYEIDNEGKIAVTSTNAIIMADGTTSGKQFDFPEDFDFEHQYRYKIIDGKLVENTEIIAAELSKQIRNERDALLKECDFTVLPDSPFTDEQRAAWTAYRQALRDIPEQLGFPFNVVFPEKPE